MATLARELYETKPTLDQARNTAISKALDFAEELMVELQVNDTINSLLDLPGVVKGAQQAVSMAKATLEGHKGNVLAGAKERYDLALLEASLEAPNDGKNEKARELQLQAFLAGQSAAAADVRKAEQALHAQESETRRLEAVLMATEADLDHARNRLRAMLAVAGLQEAVLRATKIN